MGMATTKSFWLAVLSVNFNEIIPHHKPQIKNKYFFVIIIIIDNIINTLLYKYITIISNTLRGELYGNEFGVLWKFHHHHTNNNNYYNNKNIFIYTNIDASMKNYTNCISICKIILWSVVLETICIRTGSLPNASI